MKLKGAPSHRFWRDFERFGTLEQVDFSNSKRLIVVLLLNLLLREEGLDGQLRGSSVAYEGGGVILRSLPPLVDVGKTKRL